MSAALCHANPLCHFGRIVILRRFTQSTLLACCVRAGRMAPVESAIGPRWAPSDLAMSARYTAAPNLGGACFLSSSCTRRVQPQVRGSISGMRMVGAAVSLAGASGRFLLTLRVGGESSITRALVLSTRVFDSA